MINSLRKDCNGRDILEGDIIDIEYSDISHGFVSLKDQKVAYLPEYAMFSFSICLYRNALHKIFCLESGDDTEYKEAKITVVKSSKAATKESRQ